MDYKETHISFLYDDLVKEYGNEQGKQLYALMCKKFAYLCEKEMKSENNEINEHVFQRMLPTISMYLTLIKYYRSPNTMEKNIEAAVEAYSGNIPTGLFVDKLPRNLRNLNRTFEEIKEIFDAGAINNFEELPEEPSEKRKFAKAFNQFDTYLQAAKIQGFNWKQRVYSAEDGRLAMLVRF